MRYTYFRINVTCIKCLLHPSEILPIATFNILFYEKASAIFNDLWNYTGNSQDTSQNEPFSRNSQSIEIAFVTETTEKCTPLSERKYTSQQLFQIFSPRLKRLQFRTLLDT